MSAPIVVERVATEVILPIRTQVLRPHFGPGELANWPEDDKPTTHHFAAKRDGEVVGCVTYQLAAFPHESGVPAVQLRGMAVDAQHRNSGLGAQILVESIPRLSELYPDARRLWCNARQRAVSFYERAGFQPIGEFFDKPGIGPHVVMWRWID